MSRSRRERCTSAILFALPWPLPVYAVVGSMFIVVNERLLGQHVFDASRIAEASALAALLTAAALGQRLEVEHADQVARPALANPRRDGAGMWKRAAMQHDDDLRFVPRPAGPRLADPAALAVGSLVVATLSLSGLGLLNGATYVYPLTDGMSSAARAVLAGLLGAVFALAAVVMGALASRRTHPGDPEWVSRVAQAGVLLAGLAFVLRLVATAIAAVEVTSSGYTPPL